jgi:hypothetical protein
MSIPSKAIGYGNNSPARNVFAATFSQPLSAAPTLEAYDGSIFPLVGSGTTNVGKVLVGTTGNGNRPMVSVVDTSATAPASGWKPTNATAGAANPNRLSGRSSYVQSGMTAGGAFGVGCYGTGFSAATGALGNGSGAVGNPDNPTGCMRWNEMLEMSSDVQTSDNMTYDLMIRYQYTGPAPTVSWYYNDGGTELSPVWTKLTPGINGLRHCNSGTVAPLYKLDIPPTGTVDSQEGWITT